MKLTKRLLDLIEDRDVDEGDTVHTVLLDPDSTIDEVRDSVIEFMTVIAEDNINEHAMLAYVDQNILEDNDEDPSDVDDDDEPIEDEDEEYAFLDDDEDED